MIVNEIFRSVIDNHDHVSLYIYRIPVVPKGQPKENRDKAGTVIRPNEIGQSRAFVHRALGSTNMTEVIRLRHLSNDNKMRKIKATIERVEKMANNYGDEIPLQVFLEEVAEELDEAIRLVVAKPKDVPTYYVTIVVSYAKRWYR